jgi:general secretion pathway protein A
MYLEYFGMSKAPFQIAPDDRFLYLSPKHAKALVYMDYAVSQPDGFVIVTGEIGSGKSTLVKRLLRKVKGSSVCFHLPFTNLKNNELLGYLARQAKIAVSQDDKVSLIYALTDYFKEITSCGMPCILIVDEAQNLTADNLEDIRMLAGLEGPDGTMLRVVMLGQPEFMNTVNLSEQMKQRVKLHYHLTGLSREEVTQYIHYRLEVSGTKNLKLFNEKIIDSIFKVSKGIPRLINKICDSMLMCAFSESRKKPLISDFEEVALDLMMIPAELPSKKVSSENYSANNDDALSRIADSLAALDDKFSRLITLMDVNQDKKDKKDKNFLGLRAGK